MKKSQTIFYILFLSFLFLFSGCGEKHPKIIIQTEFGDIKVEIADANRKKIIKRNMKYTRIKKINKPIDKDKPFLTIIKIY